MPIQPIRSGPPPLPAQQSIDRGPVRIRYALTCWAIAAAILIAGVVWLGASSVFDAGSPDFFPMPAGFAAIFALFGFFHLGLGLQDLARRRKTGLSSLDAGAAFLGQVFTGRIRTANDVGATGPYRLRLACEHHTAAGADEDSAGRRHIVVLWEKSLTVPKSTRSDLGIPFSFKIPADGLSSGPRGLANGDTITWKLGISAPTPGLDYAADFVVDVLSELNADGVQRRSVAEAFKGHARPEQAGGRFLRFALPIVGLMLVAGGGYASVNQLLHSWRGAAVNGVILSFNRPQAEVALDNGQVVMVPGLSSHNDWREGQRVVVTCRRDGALYDTCRMNTGNDRWIDALATLAIGLLLTAIGAWLWRRRRSMTANRDMS